MNKTDREQQCNCCNQTVYCRNCNHQDTDCHFCKIYRANRDKKSQDQVQVGDKTSRTAQLEKVIDDAVTEFLYGTEARADEADEDDRGHISLNHFDDFIKYLAKKVMEIDGSK